MSENKPAAYPHLEVLQTMDVPDDLENAVRKMELFFVRGRLEEARNYWYCFVDKYVTGHERDEDFYKDVHLRIARLYLDIGRSAYVRTLLDQVPPKYRDTKQWAMLDNVQKHINAVMGTGSYFPLNVDYDQRFEAGPHLLPSHDEEGSRLVRWIAGRVDTIDQGTIYTRIVDVAPNGEFIGEGRLNIPMEDETMVKWGSNRLSPDVQEGDFFEAGTYGSDEAVPRIQFWEREWNGWRDLPPLRIDPDRYLRASGWFVDGQTFMEKAVRREVDLDAIEDEMETWHTEDNIHVGLADYLGMLPEEHARWVEDPESLGTIVSERRAKWEEEARPEINEKQHLRQSRPTR